MIFFEIVPELSGMGNPVRHVDEPTATMNTKTIDNPAHPVASREAWLEKRIALLNKEK